MAYLEYLVENEVSPSKLPNNVSALKAHFVIWGQDYMILEHPHIRYFRKGESPPLSGA